MYIWLVVHTHFVAVRFIIKFVIVHGTVSMKMAHHMQSCSIIIIYTALPNGLNVIWVGLISSMWIYMIWDTNDAKRKQTRSLTLMQLWSYTETIFAKCRSVIIIEPEFDVEEDVHYSSRVRESNETSRPLIPWLFVQATINVYQSYIHVITDKLAHILLHVHVQMYWYTL